MSHLKKTSRPDLSSRQAGPFLLKTDSKEVAEKVDIGFELPTQSSVVARNAPKKSTNLQY
jgi:hypothetical protein